MSILAAIEPYDRWPAGGTPKSDDRLWASIAELVERSAAEVEGLMFHGLGPLAAELLGAEGLPVPSPLRRHQERMRVFALTVPFILERVRNATAEPLLLVKGPEVAQRYPGGARAYGDIDILVRDAPKAQRDLVAAGFRELDDPTGIWSGIHHLPPVRLSDATLKIEVHSEPKWPTGLQAPSVDALFSAAVPSAIPVAGVLAPDPAHHALLMAAHAWAHKPLGRVRDLVDIGALRAEADLRLLHQTARDWGIARLWRTMEEALDALLAGRSTLPLRLWAGHLRELRDQTVLEAHLERLLSPIWGYPRSQAPTLVATALVNEIRPAFDESWGGKAKRTAAALRRPSAPLGEHRRKLGDSARRGERPGGATPPGDDDVRVPPAPEPIRTARSEDQAPD
jgi:hypothetical protein